MAAGLPYTGCEQTTKKTLPRNRPQKEHSGPLLPWDRPQRKRWSLPLLCGCWLLGNVLPLLTVVSQCAHHSILKVPAMLQELERISSKETSWFCHEHEDNGEAQPTQEVNHSGWVHFFRLQNVLIVSSLQKFGKPEEITD
jgi:hypothetical protein